MKFLEHKERRRERQKILFQSHNFSFQEIRGHESRNLFNCGTFRLNMAKFRNGKYQKIIRFAKIKVCRFQMEIVWICLYRGGQEIISFPGFAGTLITLKSCPCINNQTSSKLKKLNIFRRSYLFCLKHPSTNTQSTVQLIDEDEETSWFLDTHYLGNLANSWILNDWDVV